MAGDALTQYRSTLPALAPLLPPDAPQRILTWLESGQTDPLELDGLLASHDDKGIAVRCTPTRPTGYPVWTLPGVQEAGDRLAATLADTSGGQDAWLARLAPLTTPNGLSQLSAVGMDGHAGEFWAKEAEVLNEEPVSFAGSRAELYVQSGSHLYDVGFVRVNGECLADMTLPTTR